MKANGILIFLAIFLTLPISRLMAAPGQRAGKGLRLEALERGLLHELKLTQLAFQRQLKERPDPKSNSLVAYDRDAFLLTLGAVWYALAEGMEKAASRLALADLDWQAEASLPFLMGDYAKQILNHPRYDQARPLARKVVMALKPYFAKEAALKLFTEEWLDSGGAESQLAMMGLALHGYFEMILLFAKSPKAPLFYVYQAFSQKMGPSLYRPPHSLGAIEPPKAAYQDMVPAYQLASQPIHLILLSFNSQEKLQSRRFGADLSKHRPYLLKDSRPQRATTKAMMKALQASSARGNRAALNQLAAAFMKLL